MRTPFNVFIEINAFNLHHAFHLQSNDNFFYINSKHMKESESGIITLFYSKVKVCGLLAHSAVSNKQLYSMIVWEEHQVPACLHWNPVLSH